MAVEQLECRRVMTVPAVTTVTPFGIAGDTVTVQGSGFSTATEVDFVSEGNSSSTPGTGLSIANDGELTITVPSLALGGYHITVTNPDGTSATNANDVFTDVSPAVVPATQFNGTMANASIASVPTLNVVSTADFAQSGDLFVQTTNGVATLAYTGVTSSSFTGCTLVNTDPFNVGAKDTTGTLDTGHPAVFQATHNTFDYTIQNQTGTPNPVDFTVFWSSVGANGTAPTFYYLNSSNPDGSNGKFSPVSDLGSGHTLPDYTVANSGGTTTIALPYMPLNSFRIVFGVGTPLDLGVTSTLGISTPSPTSTNSTYDFVEGTMDASGADNSVPDALRFLPTLNINTSQVDQFGFPITLTGDANVNGTNQTTSVGVTLSPSVPRSSIFSEFLALHPVGDPYRSLVIPSSDPTEPLRIVNPGKVPLTTADALGYVFDTQIRQLFETGPSLSLTSGGNVYTSTHKTIPAPGGGSYNVLEFTGPGLSNPLDIYEPFFSTNAPTGSPLPSTAAFYDNKPVAPSWLQSADETAGQMVFGNDGVFDDSGARQSLEGLNNAQTAILADLENQIVAALNRGVANLYSTTAGWTNPNNFYPAGQVFNQYAQFLHQASVDGTPIFIDGKAYAIAYDDQAGQNPSLVLLNQSDVTATFGAWPNNDPNFILAVYENVLHRYVDQAGLTYWTGQLANGATRVQVSQGIVNSLESHTDMIEGYYTSLLNRSADTQGLDYLLGLFAQGYTQSQVKSVLYNSDEYFQTRGGGTDAGFLNALYQDELNRAPDNQGAAYFGRLLTDGKSRGYVAGLLMQSQEAEQDLVQSYYVAYLNRSADADGLAHWLSVLSVGDHDSQVQAGLLGSNEYYDHI